MDDAALLAAFARDKSEAAFEELVRRHVGMVYTVCRRQLRDAHWAEDATQAVFVLLARKAASLSGEVVLGGWLYRTAMFASANARNLRKRRTYHESLVTPMNEKNEPDPVERAEMEGLLDEGLMALNKTQREVLVLRFFENKPLAEVARIRGKSLYATQKSLDAGVARLRRFLATKGVMAATAAVTVALAEQAASAVPAGLATSVGSVALGKAGVLPLPVKQLVTHLTRHAAHAKLLGTLAIATMSALVGIACFVTVSAMHSQAMPAAEAAPMLRPSQELAALWQTLAQADDALRRMNRDELAEVVAFTDPRQATDWETMASVFQANQTLKQAATAKFGAAADGITAIQTFAERLDDIAARLDPGSAQWTLGPEEASVHFRYRDRDTAGGSLYFARVDGAWKIDAGRSVEVALEGVNERGARAEVEDLDRARRSAVLEKMEALRQAMADTARDIDSGTIATAAAAQAQLRTADDAGAGRAFFRLALRFDEGDDLRRVSFADPPASATPPPLNALSAGVRP